MFFVYIIESILNGCYYIGQTKDLEKRLARHNKGLGKYTSKYLPWKLVYKEAFENRGDAVVRERVLKSYKNGVALKKLLKT